MNTVEQWKAAKHGLDVWPDLLRYAQAGTPMREIPAADLERMKWYGTFYRKRDGEGTYMLRIRIPGCELSAEQAKAVAYVAYEFGYGIVDVTTRSNFQVQGLDIAKVPTALDRLAAIGLTTKQTGHDNVRNVNCHPYSGLDPEELIDTRDLCRQITELVLDNRELADLPRKFNISLNGRDRHSAHYWTQDISFLAHRAAGGRVVFQVLVGGHQGANPHVGVHLPVEVAPEQVVPMTHALLGLFRQRGARDKRDRVRFRYLIDEIGLAGVLEHLRWALDFPLQPCDAAPPPPVGHEDFLGWFRQKQPDLWALGVLVPVGRLTWEQLEGLSLVCRRWGDGTLRTSHDQNLVVPNIPGRCREEAVLELARFGLSAEADTIIRNVVACTGKQFCNIAVTETKGHALQLIDKLRRRALVMHGVRIHMSGCPSACAQHHTADIGLKGVRVRRLLGTRDGFDVFLGGRVHRQVRLALPYKAGVDVDQLPQLIEEVIREYHLRREPGQSFSDYWRRRLDGATEAKVGDRDYQPPVWVCDHCDYRHRGEDAPIFCPSCSALRRHFARLDGEAGSTTPAAPPPTAARDDPFHVVADESELPEGLGRSVTVGGQEVALFRSQGRVFAVANACPHSGGPLAEGELCDGVVTCPWHGWTFDLPSGSSVAPAGHQVPSFETKCEGGKVLVRVPVPASLTLVQ